MYLLLKNNTHKNELQQQLKLILSVLISTTINRALLFTGTVPSLAAQISENAALFMAYGLCQKTVAWVSGTGDISRLIPLQKACAGSAGGFFCSLTLCPTELIKCKQQAMREKINAGLVEKVTMNDM